MFQWINPGPRHVRPFHNKATFYCEVCLAPSPTPKLEDNTLSTLRACLFNIFTVTLHIGSRFSLRNLRTSHAVVPETNLSWHVADSCNLRYVSGNAWRFISDKELNEIKIIYLGKNRNHKLLGTQPIMIQVGRFHPFTGREGP